MLTQLKLGVVHFCLPVLVANNSGERNCVWLSGGDDVLLQDLGSVCVPLHHASRLCEKLLENNLVGVTKVNLRVFQRELVGSQRSGLDECALIS